MQPLYLIKEKLPFNHPGATLAGTHAPPQLGLKALHSGQLQRANRCPAGLPTHHTLIVRPDFLTGLGFPQQSLKNLDLIMVQQENNSLSCELQYIPSLQHTVVMELQQCYGYRILRKYRRHKNIVINNLSPPAACVPPCPSLFSCLLRNLPHICDGRSSQQFSHSSVIFQLYISSKDPLCLCTSVYRHTIFFQNDTLTVKLQNQSFAR